MLHATLPLLILSFTLSQVGQRSVMSVFWAIPPILLAGTAAAAGIALINAIGNLGGFVGPSVMGWLRDATGGYAGGLLVLATSPGDRSHSRPDVAPPPTPIDPGPRRRLADHPITRYADHPITRSAEDFHTSKFPTSESE